MRALPPTSTSDEDGFLEGLGDAELDELVALVQAAMDARRPGLAARIVNLVPEEDVDIDSRPAIIRARRAAGLMLMAPVDKRGPVIAELEAAVAELQTRWMARARQRQRKRLKDPLQKQGGPRRRRPRTFKR